MNAPRAVAAARCEEMKCDLLGPFYAVKVLPGSFAAFAGLKTNGFAQVPRRDDDIPIEGPYAVGTDMASVMGGFYPSSDINLGPAMTLGYVAGASCGRVLGNSRIECAT
jgi:hypothetical protein